MKEQMNQRRTYTDEDGNLYFVHESARGGMKGFLLLRNPGKGQRREFGIHALRPVDTIEQAQRDLDDYAEEHGLTLCVEGRKVCNL